MTAAKDIDDQRALELVDRLGNEWKREHGVPDHCRPWAMLWDLEPALSEFPPKVVLAKMRQLLKRGLIDGCGCGCRGDFHLTDAGRELSGLYTKGAKA